MVIEEQIKSSWEEYISRGLEARETKDNCQWEIGDISLGVSTDYGEDTIGKFSFAIGIEKKTVMNYRTIASKFDKETREKYSKLSFSHFAAAAGANKPDYWLEKADDESWSVEQLRREIAEAYPGVDISDLKDDPPDVYKCQECGHWRLKDMSAFDICRGHYKLGKGGLTYI